MDRFLIAYAITLVSAISVFYNAKADPSVFNVMSYGAIGNGVSDDSSAFTKAWNDACNLNFGSPTMVIPSGQTFMVQPLKFAGPCKTSNVFVMIEGGIKAPSDPKQWKAQTGATMTWLAFEGVNGLSVNGTGVIDGQGKGWWDVICRYHPESGCIKHAPTVLSFTDCRNVEVIHTQIINSPQTHILVFACQNVHFSFVNISSPGTSPNTDGIHITSSRDVSIYKTIIAAGDDCVSIGDQTSNINVTTVVCGPGHGISIGSLGKGGGNVSVEYIRIRHVNFYGTTNGGRIKTWQTGTGRVQHIEFSNINFTSVENPIMIDQYYCDVAHNCPQTGTGVQIDDVVYSHATGTSKTELAINFNCSNNFPCKNIILDTVQLTSDVSGKQLDAACNFARGVAKGTVVPQSCLSS